MRDSVTIQYQECLEAARSYFEAGANYHKTVLEKPFSQAEKAAFQYYQRKARLYLTNLNDCIVTLEAETALAEAQEHRLNSLRIFKQGVELILNQPYSNLR